MGLYTIDAALVKQFNADVILLSQQRGSRLRNTTLLKTGVVGEDTYIDQIAKTAARKRTTRHADTPVLNTQHQRRKISMIDYDWGDLIDKEDQLKMLQDKLLAAKEILDNNDIDDMEPRFIALTGTQLRDLLNTTEIKSADYNTIKALVNGQVDTFLGFKFILISQTLLDIDSDSYRRVICWAQTGLGLAIAKDITTDVSTDITKNMATRVQAHLGIGSSRIDEDKVVEIKCDET